MRLWCNGSHDRLCERSLCTRNVLRVSKIITPVYTTPKLSGYDGNHNMNLPKSVKPGDGNAELADYSSRASVETLQETPRTGEDKVQTTIRK